MAEDESGCQADSAFTVTEPLQIDLQLTFQNESVAGANDGSATVNPTGGTTPYGEISWSNGQSGNSVTGLAPGSYSVTLTDANGCEVSASFFIAQGGCNLTASYEVSDVKCFGENNGTISITLDNSSGSVVFQWSTGQTIADAVLENLTAGNYSVTITEQNGCFIILENIMVGQPEALSAVVNITHETVPGANDGSASVFVQGGTEPFVISWSTGSSGSSVSGLAPGSYSVTVLDGNECTQIQSFVINAGSTNTIEATTEAINVYPIPTSGLLYINVPDSDLSLIRVFRLDGKEMFVEKNNSTPDLSRLENGVYIIQLVLNDGRQSFTKRIMVYKP